MTEEISSASEVEECSEVQQRPRVRSDASHTEDSDEDDVTSETMSRSTNTLDPSRRNLNGSTPGSVLRRRERKWIDMVKNWDKTMKHKPDKVKKRCRKGIPQSIRPKAWMLLSGADHLKRKYPTLFEDLAEEHVDEKVMDQIRKDLHRTLPKFELFKSPQGQGQADLLKILKCYAVHNPTIGYTQAMSDIAGSLLTVMPAEDAFWVFMSVIDNYLPNYFADGMVPLLNDANVFETLLQEALPDVDQYLKTLGIPALTYLPPWFLCLFTRTLEWTCVLRVMDMFLCEGIKVLFRVSASILQLTLGSAALRSQYPCTSDVNDMLVRRLPDHARRTEGILQQYLKMPITSKVMVRYHMQTVQKTSKVKRK